MGTIEEVMAEAVALSDEMLIEPINDVLMINPEERLIEVPKSELLLGVYTDRNVERKQFKCPRIVGDSIDLSLCYIFVNYVSSSGNPGQIQCNDVSVDETGNYITFSWLLSGNVFDKNIDSKVYFSVQAKMPSGENVFNTRKISGNVYETVEAGEEITEEYADVILQIISRIDELEQGGGITQEQIEQALNKYLETNPINVPTRLSELSEDVTHRTVTDVEKEEWNKAEENVQSDWNETDSTSDSYIKNKPKSLPNPQALTITYGNQTHTYDGSEAVAITIETGGIERIEKLATDTTVTLEPNKLYIFPEMESLTYTLGEGTGEVHFIFRSGATATRVVHPSNVNIGSFSVDANKVYEVSVLEGLLTSQNWSVS